MQRNKENVFLNQNDNYSKNFGYVYRSSSIFYYKQSNEGFNTIINFMNYWPIKRNMDVMVIASLRSMEGKLLQRERVDLSKGMVFNLQPKIGDGNFEGSLEIEAFANDNLAIPYIAVMVIYEGPESISMVHAYTRTYSIHEVEEGRTIEKGEEAGLVCRDSDDIRSFIILHNGIYSQEEQEATLWVTNQKGETREKKFNIRKLLPFETLKLHPQEIIPDLVTFLGGEPGSAAWAYQLNGGFTRTMVGNETKDGKEFQVLHSNFNYGRHDPGFVERKFGYFDYPLSQFFDRKTVHMDAHAYPGKFRVTGAGQEYLYEPGNCLDIPVETEALKIEPIDGPMPARINIVFSGFLKGHTCRLPMESARGFYHSHRPPKYNLWMVIAAGKKYRSQLIIQNLTHLYGEVGDSVLDIALYREGSMKAVHRKLTAKDLEPFATGVYVDELFPELKSAGQTNELAYLYCNPTQYGGHCAFTTIEDPRNGSMSIEHMF